MGYAGKVTEQRRARELRAVSWTLQDIATELGVSKSSVSLWVRDVEFVPRPRNRGHRSMKPHPLHVAKLAEIERCRREVLGLALYAGEGSKRGGEVRFANSDPRMIVVFVTWFRRFFAVDVSRLRVRLYLHDDLDLEAALAFWSKLTSIPRSQFAKPYRAVADATLRRNRHVYGCPSVGYCCSTTLRRVMGMIEAILSPSALPG